MSDLRDFGIEVIESDDGVRYQLPRRPLRPYRPVCWIVLLLLMGAVLASLPIVVVAALARGVAGPGNFDVAIPIIYLIVFEIALLLVGLPLIAMGLVILAGRCVIELASTQLVSFDGVRRWGLRSCRSLEQLRALRVVQLTKNGQPITEGPLSGLAGLRAEFESAKSMLVAPGYPRSWLQLVAEDIARRRREAGVALDPEREPSKPQVVDEVGQEPDPEDYTEQPADSPVIVERQPNSMVLKVPHAGLGRGWKGLFYYALFWGGFLVIFTGFAWLVSGKNLLVLAPIVIFWAAYIASLLAKIDMGRRQAVLAVVGDTLMVYQTGLFGAKRREWRRDEVASIRAGPSGVTVNDVQVLELQVHSKSGTKVGLLAGRNVDELRWLATVLRRALHAGSAG